MTKSLKSVFAGSAVLIPALLLFSVPSTSRAQSTAVASVDGTVTDPTGKSMPGAQVTMTDTDKGSVRSTVTDDRGHYALPNLPVGPYRMEVKTPGFKDYFQSGIVLVVNNNIEINVTM